MRALLLLVCTHLGGHEAHRAHKPGLHLAVLQLFGQPEVYQLDLELVPGKDGPILPCNASKPRWIRFLFHHYVLRLHIQMDDLEKIS